MQVFMMTHIDHVEVSFHNITNISLIDIVIVHMLIILCQINFLHNDNVDMTYIIDIMKLYFNMIDVCRHKHLYT